MSAGLPFRDHRAAGGLRPLLTIELTLLLAIAYTSPGNRLFGTAPLPAEVWLCILPFGVGMLLLEELRKALARRRKVSTPLARTIGQRAGPRARVA